MSVDLPEPEGPMIAVNCPAAKATSTPRSACTATSPVPYTLLRARAWTAGWRSGESVTEVLLVGAVPVGSAGVLPLPRRYDRGWGARVRPRHGSRVIPWVDGPGQCPPGGGRPQGLTRAVS